MQKKRKAKTKRNKSLWKHVGVLLMCAEGKGIYSDVVENDWRLITHVTKRVIG